MADPVPVPELTGTPTSWKSVDLSWTYDGPAATFTIERYSSVTNTTDIAAEGVSGTTYTEQDIPEVTEAVLKYHIKAVTADGESAWSPEITVITPQRPLPVPENFRSTTNSATTVTLAWTYVADPRIGRVMLQLQKTGDSGVTYWSDVQGSYYPDRFQRYVHTGLNPNTQYVYRLEVRSRGGETIRYHTESLTVTTANDIPDMPTNLTSSNVSYTSAKLSWDYTEGEVPAASFNLYRSTDATPGYTLVTTLTPDKRSYDDTGLIPATTYYYRLTSVAADGNESNPAETRFSTTALYVPHVSATDITSTSVTITWQAVPDIDGYQLQRRLANGATWTDVATDIPAADTNHQDTGLTQQTAYVYRLRVFVGPYFSDWSNEVEAVTTSPLTPPTLTATPISSTKVRLDWTVDSPVDSFTIEKSTDNGQSWLPLADLAGTVATFTDSEGNAPKNTRWYRIRSIKTGEISAWSATASATLWYAPPPPVATLVLTNNTSTKLTWTFSDPEHHYTVSQWQVLRKINSGEWQSQGTFPAATTMLEQTGLNAGTVYTYTVMAVMTTGESTPWSDPVSVTTPSAIVPPKLTAVAIDQSTIKVSWTGEPAGVTKLELQHSSDGGATWPPPPDGLVTPGSSPYYDSWLLSNTVYQYRMRATVGTNTSAWSDIVSARTWYGMPTPVLTANAISPSAVSLEWTWPDPDGRYKPQYFVIYEQSTAGGTWDPIGAQSPNIRQTVRNGLTPGKTYRYKIMCSTTTGGVSPDSNIVTVTMPT